jgi:hypothetical protein
MSTVICQQAVSCGRFPDQPTCTGTLTFDYSTLKADKAAGRISYDDQLAGDCVDKMHNGQGLGSCSQTTALSGSDLSDCDQAVVGQVRVGDPCVADAECASPAFCDFSACSAGATCCAGKCRATVGMMGDCADPSAVCDAGLACIKDPSLGMVCQSQVGSGQSCAGSAECTSGYVCIFNASTKQGTCGKLPGHGQDCAPPGNPRCDLFSDYCDPDTNKCTSRVAKGAACPKHVECAWFEWCDLTTEKCIARGLVGASCTANDECLDSLACVIGKCASSAPVCPSP